MSGSEPEIESLNDDTVSPDELEAICGAPAPPCSDRGRSPYLRVFGPDDCGLLHDLKWESARIGRAPDCELRLDHPAVSRHHAALELVSCDYHIRDLQSRWGTMVNGQPANEPVKLAHGDSIQITRFVLQFLADGSSAKMLPGRFTRLPACMGLRYRIVRHAPGEAFEPGDTLAVSQGGLLLELDQSYYEPVCLEIELIWPDKRKRRVLGEILGQAPGTEGSWCVKLHHVEHASHQQLIAVSERGEWITAQSPQ